MFGYTIRKKDIKIIDNQYSLDPSTSLTLIDYYSSDPIILDHFTVYAGIPPNAPTGSDCLRFEIYFYDINHNALKLVDTIYNKSGKFRYISTDAYYNLLHFWITDPDSGIAGIVLIKQLSVYGIKVVVHNLSTNYLDWIYAQLYMLYKI